MRLSKFLALFIFCFLPTPGLYAQHAYKLEEGVMESEEWKNEQGERVITQYLRTWHTMEGEDSVTYKEKYKIGKHWRLMRYVVKDGSPKLYGWQRDFDPNGLLILEQLCDGNRKCPDTRKFAYYPGNQLMTVANYYEDVLHGHHYVYYNNGQLRQHLFFEKGRMMEVLAYYKDDGTPIDAGTLCEGQGYVNVYAMNGSLFKIKYYRNGKVRKVKEL